MSIKEDIEHIDKKIKHLLIIVAMLFVFLSVFHEYHAFEAVKKFYPNFTYWDYVFLGDKLRIIPEG